MCRDFIQDKGKNLYCSPECKRQAIILNRKIRRKNAKSH